MIAFFHVLSMYPLGPSPWTMERTIIVIGIIYIYISSLYIYISIIVLSISHFEQLRMPDTFPELVAVP